MGELTRKPSRDVLKAIEERRKRRREEERNIDWYSWLLSDHPYLVLFLCLCIISGCVVVSVIYVEPPDFSEPSKGFEVRGTMLSDKVITWKNMYDNTGFNQTLSTYPTVYAKYQSEMHKLKEKRNSRRRNRKSEINGKNEDHKIRNRRSVVSYTWNFTTDGFCYSPKSSYARMVMQSTDPSVTLWSTEGMLAICKTEKRLLSYAMYSDVCTHLDASTCCPTFSLPNYVAFLSGLATCEEVNDKSLRRVSRLLRDCSPYYINGTLEAGCWDARRKAESKNGNVCNKVPARCTRNNAVYSIFHYLTDTDFLIDVRASQNAHFNLKHTAVFLPALRGENLAKLYYSGFKSPNAGGDSKVQVTGIDFGLKDTVFDDALHMDSIFPIIAMVMVMLVIVFYTGSVFITIMSVAASMSSLFMAYFLYTVIFEFAYFPFMNLTAIMVMVGIGADNVLVYCSAWQTYKEQDNAGASVFAKKPKLKTKAPTNRLGVITKVTLRHAARSMFVTGVTTASAFLSNFASSVTAIKCFGIYTGLTVLMNLFLCVTWLPATVIIHERNFVGLCRCGSKRTLCDCFKHFTEAMRIFFHKVQVYFIVRWRWFWLTFGMALAIGGCFAIFVFPKLRLPTTSSYFQYFKSSHPFEAYTITHSKKFAFEKKGLGYMPLTVVFGVVPTDNGNPIDPDDPGSLVFNQRFNMSSPLSQTWLLSFCEKVREQSFYKKTDNSFDKLKMCFIEAFKEWMGSLECYHDGQDNRPCCKESTFPYSPPVFTKCLKKAVIQLSNTPGIRLDRLTPGPRFDVNDTLRAVIVEFPSIQPYTGSYNDVANFYNTVETWFSKELQTAPPELREDAWFISDLEFHALQLGLYQGTLTAIGLSVAVVCVALILTTCNVTITMLANLTIACTIFVVVGILVLLGWELNILESVTISIAIGLSVDFTVHYAVAYLLVPANDRLLRVETSASTMGPAIALAALTTFLAGLCMLPAQVTAYYKFGIFLMLVMASSWFYSTYFFQALCSVIGPEGRCGNITSCCCGGCKSRLKTRYRKSTKVKLRNESSTSSRRCVKICSDTRRVSSDSPSVTVVEMSSYASA